MRGLEVNNEAIPGFTIRESGEELRVKFNFRTRVYRPNAAILKVGAERGVLFSFFFFGVNNLFFFRHNGRYNLTTTAIKIKATTNQVQLPESDSESAASTSYEKSIPQGENIVKRFTKIF